MQPDKVVTVQGNTIQHGHKSNRAYLLKLGGTSENAAHSLTELALTNGYSKAIAKVPEVVAEAFKLQGFEEEARVAGMYAHRSDGVFLAKYFASERREEQLASTFEEVSDLARKKANEACKDVPEGYAIAPLQEQDVFEMVAVFKDVFLKYPFPVYDTAFLKQTMNEGTHYFGVRFDGQLIALASAEVDSDGMNVEMTDFATLPEHRGKGLASALLTEMESCMRSMGITTSYTIARAISPGMNITFARSGYRFCGRLPNNTCIGNGVESMNVWSKSLAV